jgi:hypothetical protein
MKKAEWSIVGFAVAGLCIVSYLWFTLGALQPSTDLTVSRRWNASASVT